MSKSTSIWKELEKIERNNINRKKIRITQENIKLVDSWNQNIENKINDIENYHKTVILEKFNSEDYYNSKLTPLKIEKYVPLKKPNERKLRKKLKCIKYNAILEKVFKNRKEKRIQRGEVFEREWENLNIQYEKEEKKHLKEYNSYKQKLIDINNKENEQVNIAKQNYNNNNPEEIRKVVEYYLNNNKKLQENSIGVNYISINVNDSGCWQIEMGFELPNKIVPEVKKYTYLKTKYDTKETYFNNREKENIFQSIVFNSALYYVATITYAFFDKIDIIILNCYVNKINLTNGINEKVYFLSAMFNPDIINYNNISLIDSKAFFDSINTKYNLPLLNLKKVIPYSNQKIDSIDFIDKSLSGFDFEKLSKTLLECNNFVDVVVTKASADYGADLIAYKDKIKYAIQCKKYSSKVGVKAVQEVMASREIYKCHVGAILTNNYFTPNAIKLAEENKIILWDKNELIKMLECLNSNDESKLDKIEFKKQDSILETNKDYFANNNHENTIEKSSTNTESFKKEIEQEMDALELEDWQKELVRNGEFHTTSFDEDEIDEDSYFYEDD
ncbi:MAG: restriction endonuclease [Clostridiales bacterium]|nr:restriction endonuclease [Clostridiales bacterium]